MGTVSKKYQSGCICVVLVLLVAAAFEPVRHNSFVDYDDEVYIVSNPYIQSGFTTQSLIWAFTSSYGANWYPLTWLSHMLDMELFGLNPVGHHIHNVILHAAGVVLLFLVLRTMTGSVWRSAFVAAVFGIHPLRVESVAWAAERKDVLCALFWMLTISAYIGYVRQGGFLRYMAVMVCLGLGLMAKPMIVTLPVVLLLLDVWPLNRFKQNQNLEPAKPARDRRAKKDAQQRDALCRPISMYRAIVEKIPLFILIFISSVITYRVQQRWGAVDATQLTWQLRLTNIPISYAKYLLKTAWPVDLAVLYPFPKDGWPAWQVAGALLMLAVLSAWAFYTVKKRPYLFVGWFWYVITLVPVIGLVQVGNQSMADRYSYLPSIGILIILAWGLWELFPAWRYRKRVYTALGVISIIALVAFSRNQVVHWKDTYSHYQYTVSVTQDNFIIYNNLAKVFLEEGKLDEASGYLQKSLAICPGYCLANINMALLLKDKKQPDEALICIDNVMKYASSQWQVHMARGEILDALGRPNDALQSYKNAIDLNGDEYLPFYNAGLVLAKQGSLQEAIHYFQEAIRLNPGHVGIYRDLGQAKQFLNQLDEAVSIYQKALKIKPDDHAILYRLGYCLEKQGKLPEAIDCYRRVLQLKPDFLPGLNQLAMILATASDGSVRSPQEAVELSKKACEITLFKDYRALGVLAVAYAGTNQFQEAIDALQKAIPLAQANKDMDSARQLSEKIELYRNGRASSEPGKNTHETTSP
jgi:protein O-mannosyl-transferase